ncbi:MAG: CaiB/BaiF CoA-transferase family protein [Alphaproteobacteria bacterium]
MSGALEGTLVIALEQAVAAPLASSRLADAGARVIKIERPEGDFARDYDHVVHGESAYFVWLNRGKESVTLDLKTADDKALAGRMVAKADIFIQNLMPGASARLGFDSAQLRRRHQGLITCDISGYGEGGPYRDMKAYDLLVQGESGLASVTGTPAAPGRVGVSVCDIAAGLYAHSAILEALIQRQSSGVGAGLRVSLFDGMADWMTVPLLHYEHGGKAPPRAGLHHPSIAPYGAYKVLDGEIMICIQNPREWRRFCADVLGRPELADDRRYADNPARVANRTTLDQEIDAQFAPLKADELISRLEAAGIAYGRVNGVDGLARHPGLRRIWVETPSGPVELVAPPANWHGTGDDTPRRLGPVPAPGQHTDAIREEFCQ